MSVTRKTLRETSTERLVAEVVRRMGSEDFARLGLTFFDFIVWTEIEDPKVIDSLVVWAGIIIGQFGSEDAWAQWKRDEALIATLRVRA